jgi:hypothetical protein
VHLLRFEEHWLFAVATTQGNALLASLIDPNLASEAAWAQVLREVERAERLEAVGAWRDHDERWSADLKPIA